MEGTDAGMPTSLPWGIKTPGDHVLGRVHPVQLYTFLVALLLCMYLMRRLKREHRMGEVASLGLFLSGAASLPAGHGSSARGHRSGLTARSITVRCDCHDAGWSRVHWAAVGFAPVPRREEVADYLEQFIKAMEGHSRRVSMRDTVFSDPLLLETQSRFLDLPRNYPAQSKAWCNREGLEVLEWYATQLRVSDEQQRRKAS